MRELLINLTITIFTTWCLVSCDQSVNAKSVAEGLNGVHENPNSVKTKRGIHGFAGLRYLPPAPPPLSPYTYIRHTPYPYSNFPGRIFTRPNGPAYALTPGNAVVHSYNANYPRYLLPKPVLRPAIPPPLPPPVLIQPKPIVPSFPVYTNRYPVFVQKPFVVPKPLPPSPQFGVPNFVSFPSHVHSTHAGPVPLPTGHLPPSTLYSQNGWKPLYTPAVTSFQNPPVSTVPYFSQPTYSHSHLPSTSQPHRPSNYYLPADPLPEHDVATHTTNDALSPENGMQIRVCSVCVCVFFSFVAQAER